MLCLSLATPGASTARGSGGGTVNATSGVSAVTGAYLCFEDEAGQNLRPPKARTWASRPHPRGPGVGQGLGPGLGRRAGPLQARCAQPFLLPGPHPPRPHMPTACPASGGQGWTRPPMPSQGG